MAMRFARLFHPTTLILIAANLLPLAGIYFWGWDTFLLLALYWMETAIIGFWTILAVAILSLVTPEQSRTSRLFLVPFFIFHSGIFMTVHFMFLWSLFAGNWPNLIHSVRDFIDRIVIGEGLWIPLLALFVSRGVSFFFVMFGPMVLPSWVFAQQNPSPDGDPRDDGNLLKGFYQRIVIMHLTIIFGAMIAIRLGSTAPLMFMVALKIAIDLKLHLKNDFPAIKPVVVTTV